MRSSEGKREEEAARVQRRKQGRHLCHPSSPTSHPDLISLVIPAHLKHTAPTSERDMGSSAAYIRPRWDLSPKPLRTVRLWNPNRVTGSEMVRRHMGSVLGQRVCAHEALRTSVVSPRIRGTFFEPGLLGRSPGSFASPTRNSELTLRSTPYGLRSTKYGLHFHQGTRRPCERRAM